VLLWFALPKTVSLTVTALLVLAVAPAAHAEVVEPAWRTIPVGEIGALARVSRMSGGTIGSENSIAFAVRMEGSLIGLFLPYIDEDNPFLKRFRIGELIGFDVGISLGGSLAGRGIAGGQASYEITRDFGLGGRIWFESFIDPVIHDGGSHNVVLLNAEVSARLGSIVLRVRKSVGADDEADNLGVTLRVPISNKIGGYKGWYLGADLDSFSFNDVVDPTMTVNVYAAHAVVALGF
jgi:hypothetical protein